MKSQSYSKDIIDIMHFLYVFNIIMISWISESIKEQKLYVEASTGLRYAKVSGDWNPHHLYPWTAKLLGFKSPIAHGLWTLAVAMSFITGVLYF